MALLDTIRSLFAAPRAKTGTGVGRPPAMMKESMVLDGEVMRAYLPIGKDGASVRFLPVDEIISRKGWQVYRDMRNDDQVKSTLVFKKTLIYGRALEVQPAEPDDQESKDVAKFVEWALERINFKHILREALTALEFGFSLGEIVWETAVYEGNTVVTLKTIKHRDPQHIYIEMDKYGNIKRFAQLPFWGGEIYLDPSKAWHYAHDTEFQNPYGNSDLRAVYKNWWAKKFLVNFWNVFLERLGQPMTMVKYPLGASETLKNTLKSILSGLSTKTEILVPEGVDVQLIEAQRAAKADFGEALKYHDNAIARGLLMVALFGMGGDDIKRGADSQSHLHLRLIFKMADEISKNLIYTFTQQVMKQLVDYNFNTDKYPELCWQDYGEFEGVQVADTIRLLHAAGIIDMDQEDVNYARSVLGLPLRGEDDEPDEVLRPPAPPPPGNPNEPPPAADQGNLNAKKGAGGDRKTDPATGAPQQ